MGPMSARSSLPKTALAVAVSMGGEQTTPRRLCHAERRRTFRCRSDQGRAGRYSSGHAVVLAARVGDANIRAVVDFLRTLQGKPPTNATAKGLRCGQEDQRAQAAHRGRYAWQPLGGGRPFGRQSGPAGTALVQDPAQTAGSCSALSRGWLVTTSVQRLRITPRLDGNHDLCRFPPPAPASSM